MFFEVINVFQRVLRAWDARDLMLFHKAFCLNLVSHETHGLG